MSKKRKINKIVKLLVEREVKKQLNEVNGLDVTEEGIEEILTNVKGISANAAYNMSSRGNKTLFEVLITFNGPADYNELNDAIQSLGAKNIKTYAWQNKLKLFLSY